MMMVLMMMMMMMRLVVVSEGDDDVDDDDRPMEASGVSFHITNSCFVLLDQTMATKGLYNRRCSGLISPIDSM